ncbi:SAV_2336 N-terminal domain-related protein [Streptomyces chartreusis]
MSQDFDRVLEALEAIGIEPTARETAETLWLATHIARSANTTAPQAARSHGPHKDSSAHAREQPVRSTRADKPAALHPTTAAAAATAFGEGTTHAVAVRIADAPALPHGLELMRALRPLKRKVPSRHRVSLDETATAERSAEERLFLPATRPEPERWLSLALIVDTGPTMTVWHPLVHELTLLLQRTGAFKDIRRWHLHSTPEGELGLHPRATPTSALHSAREILDPTGRQAVWCVSDCVSAPWHDGRADHLLETWGRSGPLAIIQPLPQRLWRRTGLSPEPVRLHAASPASANARLRTTSSDSAALLRTPAGGMSVPVLELDGAWLSGWSRLITATAPSGVAAVVTTTDTHAAPPGDDAPAPPSASADPLNMVRTFRAHASPQAYRLAGCLAQVTLTLPVMRLVQRVMLPESRPAHLAEVLLSGLVHHIPSTTASPVYDFADGVRTVLASTLRRSDSHRIYHEISTYLAAHAGTAHDTQALAVLPSGQGDIPLAMPSQPFAEITLRQDSSPSRPEPEPHTTDEDQPETSAGPLPVPAVEERRLRPAPEALLSDVVDVLVRSAGMMESSSLRAWSQALANNLGRPIEQPRAGRVLRNWLLDVVRTCTEVPNGLRFLLETVQVTEGPSSRTFFALRHIVQEWEATEFFHDADLRPLRPRLQTIPAEQAQVLVERATRSRVRELPQGCTTGWETLLYLTQINWIENDLPPAMAFVEVAAQQYTERGQLEDAEALRRWNRTQAQALGLIAILDHWRPATPTQSAVLTIQLDPSSDGDDRYRLSQWRRQGSQRPVPGAQMHVRRDEIPRAVGRAVEETEAIWADVRQVVTLEFVLPNELLNEPVEWWLKEDDSLSPMPLALDYPVVLRSLERQRHSSWRGSWRSRWRNLTNDPRNRRVYESRVDATDPSHPFHLERELKEDGNIVCLILNQPPSDESGLGSQELLAGLRSGVPVMIWHRRDCADPAFRAAVEEIVQGDNGLNGLMDWVTKWRREALAAGPEEWDGRLGRHLAILLDDPEHVPVPRPPSL